MAGDKTYITDDQGKLHRATRVHAVTPTDIVWSNNRNDYSVQVKIDGKWHRAILTYDVSAATYFDNVNIDKALVTGADGKQHTALIVNPENAVTLSPIKTDEHALVNGTTTGETAVCTYSEAWSDIQWQDNVNVYKVLVTGSDGKVHTAILTTGGDGEVEAIVMGVSPLSLPNAVDTAILSLVAFGGTKQGLPDGYTPVDFIRFSDNTYLLTNLVPSKDCKIVMDIQTTNIITSPSTYLGAGQGDASGLRYAHVSSRKFRLNSFGETVDTTFNATSNTRYKYIFDNSVVTIISEGTELFNQTFTGTGSTTYPLAINGYNVSGTVSACPEDIYLYSFKMWDAQGELIANYVPCIQDQSLQVGLYDIVTKTFIGTPTVGTWSAGPSSATGVLPEPDAPIDIVCNNGVLKWDSVNQTVYADGLQETIAIKDDQNATVSTAVAETLLSVGTYTDQQEIIDGTVTRKVGVKVLDGTENWIISGGVGVWANFQSIIGTGFARSSALCSHSDYAGADTSVANMSQNQFSLYTNGNIAFKNAYTTSTTDWANFLADQYANGTPVIVIYQLATPTTESVTPQPMQTAAGDNTAEITQASLDNLELKVTYMKQGS